MEMSKENSSDMHVTNVKDLEKFWDYVATEQSFTQDWIDSVWMKTSARVFFIC